LNNCLIFLSIHLANLLIFWVVLIINSSLPWHLWLGLFNSYIFWVVLIVNSSLPSTLLDHGWGVSSPSSPGRGASPLGEALIPPRPPLAGLVGGEERGVHGFEAGGAGEGAHQPVVDALLVVGVHAGQVTQRLAHVEVHHADHAPGTQN
jgi:hypothetical protein